MNKGDFKNAFVNYERSAPLNPNNEGQRIISKRGRKRKIKIVMYKIII